MKYFSLKKRIHIQNESEKRSTARAKSNQTNMATGIWSIIIVTLLASPAESRNLQNLCSWCHDIRFNHQITTACEAGNNIKVLTCSGQCFKYYHQNQSHVISSRGCVHPDKGASRTNDIFKNSVPENTPKATKCSSDSCIIYCTNCLGGHITSIPEIGINKAHGRHKRQIDEGEIDSNEEKVEDKGIGDLIPYMVGGGIAALAVLLMTIKICMSKKEEKLVSRQPSKSPSKRSKKSMKSTKKPSVKEIPEPAPQLPPPPPPLPTPPPPEPVKFEPPVQEQVQQQVPSVTEASLAEASRQSESEDQSQSQSQSRSDAVGESTIRPNDDGGSSMLPDNSFNKSYAPPEPDASSFRSEMSDVSGLSAMEADSTYDTASMASKRRRRRLKGDTVSNFNYGGGNDDSVFTVDENESALTNFEQSDASFMPSKEKAMMIKDMAASMRDDRSFNASAISNLSDMSRMSAVPGEASSISMTSTRMMDGNDSSFVSSVSNSLYSTTSPSAYDQSAISDVKSIGMGASIDGRSYNESKLTFNYELSENNYDESGLTTQDNSNLSEISDLRSIKSLGLKYMIDEDQSLLSGHSNVSKMTRKPQNSADLKSIRSSRSPSKKGSKQMKKTVEASFVSNISKSSVSPPSAFGNEADAKGAESVGAISELSANMSSMADSYRASEYEASISPSAFGNESVLSDLKSMSSKGGISSFQDDNTFQNSMHSGNASNYSNSISPSQFNSESGFEASNASAMSKQSKQSKKSTKSDNKSISSKKSSKAKKKDQFDDDKLKKLNEKIEQRRAPAKPIKRKHNDSSEESSISIDYDGMTTASQSALSGNSGISDVSGLSGLSTSTYDSAIRDVLQSELDKMEMSGISQISEAVPQLKGKHTKKLKALNKMNEKEGKKIENDKLIREAEKKKADEAKALEKQESK